ncbi:hypothetical protein HS041_12385 [Planomonospora sp. ID67723]|uniref:hypothetical protein n=1 Tax=Planomonospora sp. ID67723 TaxID=2738134 RepID=UPI0018C3D1C9|nr:hypothetical protein [Planomonospora sp. ID67723]MBG0828567.1 hypothetical protein [Planomonospora sp. ID67723]
MVASVRSTSVTVVSSGSAGVIRGEAREGDVLLAIHSVDGGSLSQLTISGGWELLSSRAGGSWAGTKVWGRVATASEQQVYGVGQTSTADGVVTIVAIRGAGDLDDIVITSDSGPTAPPATPGTGSGLDLRYAAGLESVPASISWTVPTGYTELVDEQASVWTSAVLASRALSSSTALGQATFVPTPSAFVSHAFTIVVPSAASTEPTPPEYPAYTPGRGTALYSYQFRRLLDGQFLGALDLSDVSFDKRILQPGSLSAKIDIPNRTVADVVASIIPRDASTLTAGPGVIVCDIWRAGEPWGEYWITGATVGRSGEGTPSIQLRGSTLEAYLLHVELQDDLTYTGQDQVDIARDLIEHMASQDYADLGLILQSGVSGALRTISYRESDGGTYGQRLVELAELDDGFEWGINITAGSSGIERHWVWADQLGQQSPALHVFSDGRHGGDILEWREEIDALRGATRWRARGGTPSSGDASTVSTPLVSAVHEASAHLAAGWPRLDRTLSKSSVTVQQTLEDYAAYWATVAPGALRVDSITVALGAQPSFTPNSLGDAARIYLDNEWHEASWRTRRIIGVGITPTSKQHGKEVARLILEGADVE